MTLQKHTPTVPHGELPKDDFKITIKGDTLIDKVNVLSAIPERLKAVTEQLDNLYKQQEAAKAELNIGAGQPQESVDSIAKQARPSKNSHHIQAECQSQGARNKWRCGDGKTKQKHTITLYGAEQERSFITEKMEQLGTKNT